MSDRSDDLRQKARRCVEALDPARDPGAFFARRRFRELAAELTAEERRALCEAMFEALARRRPRIRQGRAAGQASVCAGMQRCGR